MIFQKKVIKLNSSNSLNANEIRKTETFSSNERKYRIYKGAELVIEREYQDYFDRIGIEPFKFCISAKGNFNLTDDGIITTLNTQVKNGVNNLFTISCLILLLAALCLDVTFGTYSTVAIIIIYGVIYLLLSSALSNFNEELSNDLSYYKREDNSKR